MMGAISRVVSWALVVGGVSFSIGFFGPMLLAPGANQGPLLGILITGPLGTLAGLGIGVVREVGGWNSTPGDLLRSRGIGRPQLLRGAAAVGGAVFFLDGLRGLPAGEGRGAAAALVVGFALLWYAVAGRTPTWFRR